MKFGGKREARAAADRLEEALGLVPENPVKHFRGERRQAAVALKAGITQQHLSDLERGRRSLTEDVASRLGPVLGVDADGLLGLDRLAALKNALSTPEGSGPGPEFLLRLLTFIEERLPEGPLKADLRAVLAGAIREEMERIEAERPAVATKTRKKKAKATRDAHGRRTDDPFGVRVSLKSGQEAGQELDGNGRVPRDIHGRVLNKPFAPSRYA